ncbi:hypothetical protein [Pseudomonas sp. NPDC089569]|uniref:hypothetical protein n=1 Tax=Pseudomonas sp. NPDC089569 TaxID=3390722 RepID=UPI003CFF23D6
MTLRSQVVAARTDDWRLEMAASITRRSGKGTINAIRKVWIDATSIQFALVIPDGSRSRLAIRIGLNLAADGEDRFQVGDRVTYTLLMGAAGEYPRVQDLMKSGIA